jgi:hypothetical protein
MDNPYAPPSSAERETKSDSVAIASAAPRKPARVWVLQLSCVLELVALLGITVASVPAIPPDYLRGDQFLPDLLRFASGLGLLVTTTVSLQRRFFSRPDIVAPLAAGALLLAHLFGGLLQARRLSIPVGQLLVSAFVFTVFLWLVGSLFLHAETRAYLRGVARGE